MYIYIYILACLCISNYKQKATHNYYASNISDGTAITNLIRHKEEICRKCAEIQTKLSEHQNYLGHISSISMCILFFKNMYKIFNYNKIIYIVYICPIVEDPQEAVLSDTMSDIVSMRQIIITCTRNVGDVTIDLCQILLKTIQHMYERMSQYDKAFGTKDMQSGKYSNSFTKLSDILANMNEFILLVTNIYICWLSI